MASPILHPLTLDNAEAEHLDIGERSDGGIATSESDAKTVVRVFPIRLATGQDLVPTSSAVPALLQSLDFNLSGLTLHEAVLKPSLGATPLRTSTPLLTPPKSQSGSSSSSTLQIPEHVSTSGQRYVTNKFNFGLSTHDYPTLPHVAKGNKVYRCDQEPIHIPGAVQSFGALVALRQDPSSNCIVRIASENTGAIIGREPEELFNLRCFTDMLSANYKTEFMVRMKALCSKPIRTDPDVHPLALISTDAVTIHVFCAMHLNDAAGLIICEFELEKEIFTSKHPPEHGLPAVPVQVIDHQIPTEAARLLSTTNRSTPLHAVDIARESSRPLGSLDLFHILSEVQAQLSKCTELPALLDIIVGLVYELTSFHRVMVYQFDENAAVGCVKSEIVDPRASSDIYRGLHFPSSDIPRQARELYLINRVRILYDREQETARLVCRTLDDASIPLDLKHSYLRAMSPIHLRYLSNIGVRASMSISLVVDGKLWGLISCHNYGSSMRVPAPVRELCRSLGDIASNTIGNLLYAARVKARKALSIAPPKTSPSAYVAASSGDLLSMFDADFGFLVIKGEARAIGRLMAYEESIVLLQFIRDENFTSIFSTNAIRNECPTLKTSAELSIISGMLVIPLNPNSAEFLVFFRKGILKHISWAGNPYEKATSSGRNYLEPRSSFRRWSELVVGTSANWTEDQLESAAVLLTLYSRFIEVWRQKEAIVQKNRMTRILIQNAGHEARTPLNSIINYLEIVLEDNLDKRARLHLQRSLQASKSLVFVVNDLLNLTEVEDAVYNMYQEYIDLKALMRSLVTAFEPESSRKNLKVVLNADDTIPSIVKCNGSDLRQVISNLLANAIQHSEDGYINMSLRCTGTSDLYVFTEISIEDKGRGLEKSQLDNLFQDFEKILDDEDGESTSTTSANDAAYLKTINTQIGLGLALTARFVRLNNGQIAISSAGLGRGAKVSITVPFHKASIQPRHATLNPTQFKVNVSNLPTPPTPSEPSAQARTSFFSPILSPITTSYSDFGQVSVPGILESPTDPTSPMSPETDLEVDKLNILVAEDNPLNSRLLQTRLSRKGHGVQVAVDGQACADAFKQNTMLFDIILMDIQMPLVSGVESTRIIRDFERVHSPPSSPKVSAYGRIPIIAVSASLVEKSKLEYSAAGFDGWITKPINFKRLERIMDAARNAEKRRELAYGSDEWENGGWFVT
ncbi:uncharacterized protein LY89DRAFT_593827 [Mollisia scopiformis]|uniref:Phytochrome n=1 Tax=Mollisia scopiformis TaxID=149040 RepID=A0A194WW50_MOLSC|nr:uncharacterized protein LY89DRAFT_593827 [Mollisia scopiformis]KUJ12195.1 hypothetical protein LY89DRAFT_593827 [Mollisia scopiformis]